MISPADTAYPLLQASPTARDLDELYTPDLFELGFAEQRTRDATSCLGLLVLLKTFQRLGYFVRVLDVPVSVIRHIAKTAGYEESLDLSTYDQSSLRARHMMLVRSWVGVSPYGREARTAMLTAAVEASRTREDLADIVNSALEQLVRQRFELPGFTTLFRGARTARSTVNRGLYARLQQALTGEERHRLDQWLVKGDEDRHTAWDLVKTEPGQPTVKGVHRFLAHLTWLNEQSLSLDVLAGVPAAKLQRFSAEARALNAAHLGELIPAKRYALMAALVVDQRAQAFDDAADMLIRLVHRMDNTAQERLKELQAQYLVESVGLVTTLHGVALAYCGDGSAEERLRAIGAFLEPDIDGLLHRCEEHEALASGNHLRLLPACYRHPRQALLSLLAHLPVVSTSTDKSLPEAMAFVLAHQGSRADTLPIIRERKAKNGPIERVPLLDLQFVPDAFWPLVTGQKSRATTPARVNRRFLELCVMVQVANELKSGDLCLPASKKFRDYREQLLPWDAYQREVVTYGEQAGIAIDPKLFVAELRRQLEDRARATDQGFPTNQHLRMEEGEPVLTPADAEPDPAGLDRALALLKERLLPVEILDAFADTEHWLHWTRHFGPISGLETKLVRARERYLLTVFCYGCNLGPTQTARSVRGANRFQLAFINQRHITEANLNEAITTVVNAYVQIPLQRLWGAGKSASADGMKWDLYPQNLMAEYHLRYGGYGGIGYYLVADNYIALMSRWTTCGAWEGHAILDFLKENESDVHPETVHADTQGQSTAIFGLAYLLGIELLPGIRNWKNRHLHRPSPDTSFEHIDALFTAQVDWNLIESMLPELLHVAVSIKSGTLLPSDILRRLGSYSRKNKLYYALRELGRVVRTMFLLRFLDDVELRQVIHAATTKSERFNKFVQWVSFGGDGTLTQSIRDEQRKFIKYNHLVSNLLALHNVVAMMRAIDRLQAEGHEISDEVMAALSPYQTEHINRFGQYQLRFGRAPEPLPLPIRKPPQSAEVLRDSLPIIGTTNMKTC